jgi:hypothetical protein
MIEETSAGAPPRVQARGQVAAMQRETATGIDWPTRRRGERLAAMRPPNLRAAGSRVEGASREGLTASEVLTLALLSPLVLVVLASMLLINMVLYALLVLVVLGAMICWPWRSAGDG